MATFEQWRNGECTNVEVLEELTATIRDVVGQMRLEDDGKFWYRLQYQDGLKDGVGWQSIAGTPPVLMSPSDAGKFNCRMGNYRFFSELAPA